MLTSISRAEVLEMLAPLGFDPHLLAKVTFTHETINIRLYVQDETGHLQCGPSGQSAIFEHVELQITDEVT